MRIFIAGGKGQLGTALQAELLDHEVTAVDLPELDITDKDALFTAVSVANPEMIINSAAYTNVDGCAKDPELAYRVNGLGAQNLALAALEHDIPMVHISTNEVFPGQNPNGYDEWHQTEAVNPYGRSKLAGEFLTRSILNKLYIVRFSWLFAPGGHNFIHAILRRAQETGQIRVVTDEVANPTYVKDLAQGIVKMMQSGQFGTYHLGNSGSCSRWEFANEIVRLAGLENVTNTPISGREFKRASTPPPYCALNNNVGKAIGLVQRPWQEALAEYIAEFT